MIHLILLFLTTSAIFGLHSNNIGNTKDAQVFRVIPNDTTQLKYLQKIFRAEIADFWTLPRLLGVPVDIMSIGWMVPVMKNDFKAENIEYSIIIDDVEEFIKENRDKNEKALKISRENNNFMDWTAYHTYEEIDQWMDSLHSKFPAYVTVKDVGISFEGRKLKLLKISSGGTAKPAIWVNAGIHGREWIAPAAATFIINELLKAHSEAINALDFYFMPLINPDGYAYTWSETPLWSKTRSDAKLKTGCVGVDPDRNWDFHWNEKENITNACADKYPGPEPFSEMEMSVVRDEILKVAKHIKMYLSFQQYGQSWLGPWSFSEQLAKDSDELDVVAAGAVKALASTRGTKYKVGSTLNNLFCSTGTSTDWAKGVAGIKYSYVVELPDEGEYGFFLPPERIIEVGKETFSAFSYLINFVKETYGARSAGDSLSKEEL